MAKLTHARFFGTALEDNWGKLSPELRLLLGGIFVGQKMTEDEQKAIHDYLADMRLRKPEEELLEFGRTAATVTKLEDAAE